VIESNESLSRLDVPSSESEFFANDFEITKNNSNFYKKYTVATTQKRHLLVFCPTMMDHLQSALAEAAGGATAGAIADGVLYGIDSAKVRAQSEPIAGSGIKVLYRGFLPTILCGSVPVFGTFFLLYAPLRDGLKKNNRTELLPLASAICAVPATIIAVPSDVLKKRLVLGLDDTVSSALRHAMQQRRGIGGLFAGWQVNIIRDIPFAGVKIGLYEWFAYEYCQFYRMEDSEGISAVGASICGVTSGVCCAILTAPLDVINTRIKAGTSQYTSILKVASEIVGREGVSALFRGVAMRSVVLGVGSSIFWPIQRTVAHTLHSREYNSISILFEF
jgi:hypothetical protein